MKTLVNFLKDEQGLETVEWVVMAALIVLGLVALVGTFKEDVAGVFTEISEEITDAQATGG
jgi:Flp pilus assembly pilin Flp